MKIMNKKFSLFLLFIATTCAAHGEKPLQLGKHGTELQLFVDDYIISSLDGKVLKLRMEIQNADLYSFQFQPWLR